MERAKKINRDQFIILINKQIYAKFKNMTSEIFIDGEAGTTGLVIRELLAERSDLSFISLNDPERKNETARKNA